MPAAWLQWMPLYIQRLKSNPFVIAMHPTARSGYIWLFTEQWQSDDCTLPNDLKKLRAMSGLGMYWEDHAEEILDRFHSMDGDRLRCDFTYELWMEAKAKYDESQLAYEFLREKRSKAGKYGVQVREAKREVTKEANEKQTGSKPEAELKQTESKTEAKSCLTATYTETNTKDLSTPNGVSPRKSSGNPDPVEEIYKAYPRKVGKDAAIKAITKAVLRIKAGGMPIREAEVYLFRRVQSYARSPAGNDGEFTPHPATWFNRGSYDDDPAEWQKLSSERGKSNGNQGRNGFSGEQMSRLLDSFGGSETDNAN